jgi:NADH-quinone oxidoreductase subunit A
MAEYFPILVFTGIALVIALVMLAIPFITSRRNTTREQMQAYECGFEAFDSARRTFDVRFYLVAILFIVFDLEVAFLFPWAMVLPEISWFGFGSMLVFLSVLTIGFVYEWRMGALEWE